MDLELLVAILLLFHLLPCPYTYSASTCPDKFKCQNLLFRKPISLNFSEYSCGLCAIHCHTNYSPKIKTHRWSGQVFDVLDMTQSDTIKVRDPQLKILLDGYNCNSFFHNIDLPNSDSFSYTILDNSTLFRCSKLRQIDQKRFDYFSGYKTNKSCEHFDIYYRVQNNSYGSELNKEPLPLGCSAVHLPMRSVDDVPEDSNVFDLLTAEFHFQWHPSDECDQFCQLGRDQYISYEIDQFHCAEDERGKKKLKVNVGTCTAGGGLLAALVTLLIFYKKRKGKVIRKALLLLRRNSSESSAPDLEGGIYFGIPVFTYGELEKVTNNFAASKELGNGGFGTVYYGRLHDGREVAVKRLYEHTYKRMAQFMNEIEILTRLRHPNLVSLYGCTSRRSHKLLLVYEYIPNGTVADHLHGDRAKDRLLTWPMRMSIAIETAAALVYLHASDIIHRDVKTDNILLDHNFRVKVADFGLSRLFPNVSHVSTAPQGTPGYVDPEYHHCYQLTDKSDVYSFGVVLIELISSMPAVDISRLRDEIKLSNLAVNRIPRHAFNELIDQSLGYELDPEVMRMTTSVAELAFRCLQHEREMRPGMDEVLQTLKAIQDFPVNFIHKTNEANGNTVESKRGMVA